MATSVLHTGAQQIARAIDRLPAGEVEIDARLLDVLDRRGRRRGLRWRTLERLLHCATAPRRLQLATALGRQVDAGRVERRGERFRRPRPP